MIRRSTCESGTIVVNPERPSFEESASATTRLARPAIVAPTSAIRTCGVVIPASTVRPSQPRKATSAEKPLRLNTVCGPTNAW